MNSTKLDGDLQPILGPSSQFFLTNIKISKFSDCNFNLLKFARILAKENYFNFNLESNNSQDFTNKKSHSWKHRFHVFTIITKRHFISFIAT